MLAKDDKDCVLLGLRKFEHNKPAVNLKQWRLVQLHMVYLGGVATCCTGARVQARLRW